MRALTDQEWELLERARRHGGTCTVSPPAEFRPALSLHQAGLVVWAIPHERGSSTLTLTEDGRQVAESEMPAVVS